MRSYARADYNYQKRKGESPFKEIKVILDNNDTTTASQGIIQEAVGISVLPDEKIAVTFTYFPGNPYNVGDTIDPLGSFQVGKKINCFTIYDGYDKSMTIDLNYYNHAMLIPSSVRYNVSPNGWNGKYIPGVAYTAGFYHTDVFFRLTYDDYTGIADQEEQNVLSVYPNPASTEISVEYRVADANRAVLEFSSMLGNVVKSEVLDARLNKSVVNISDLDNGVYFYSLKVDGKIVGTSRLVIAR